MNKLFGKDLADDLKNSCFSDEDAAVIEYKTGKREIPISKQFLHFYKDYRSKYETKEDFYDNFAIILEYTRPILNQLKLLQEQAATLYKPESYRAKTVSTGKTLTNNKTTGNTNNKTTFKGEYFDFNASQGQDVRKGINIAKDGTTQTSKLYNIEKDWITRAVKTPEIPELIKKKITMNEQNEVVISETTQPAVEQTEVVEGTPVNTYNNINFNRADISNIAAAYSQREGGSKTRNAADFTGLNINLVDGLQNSDVETSTYIEGDTVLQSITKQIPVLKHSFWRSFLVLFYV